MTFNPSASLLFLVGEQCCALPVEFVREVMRPQPLVAAGGADSSTLGLALIRGRQVPVINMAALASLKAGPAKRLITIRVQERIAALAVEEVRGVVSLAGSTWELLPPLLSSETAPFDAVAALDGELVLRLSAVRIVPDWISQ